MTSLTDTQRILLSAASQEKSGSFLPLPACLKPGGGTSKALGTLFSRGFAEERETSEAGAVRRTEGDLRFGLFITAPGLAAIGIETEGGGDSLPGGDASDAGPSTAPVAKTSKAAAVLALLARADGATTPELIEATGWLPHTTRAALTGLRKKGHAIERGKRDGATCYRIVSAA
jgi:hypothetical protein